MRDRQVTLIKGACGSSAPLLEAARNSVQTHLTVDSARIGRYLCRCSQDHWVLGGVDPACPERISRAWGQRRPQKERPMTAQVFGLDARPGRTTAPTDHARPARLGARVADLTTPEDVVWCDGSAEEWQRLTARARRRRHARAARPGEAAQLVLGAHRPRRRGAGRGAHLHLLGRPGRRRPDQQLDGAGRDEGDHDRACTAGCMRGRTMYVIPFCMGPLDRRRARCSASRSPTAPYVVASMRIMTRMGAEVLAAMGDDAAVRAAPCTRSARRWRPGRPTSPGRATRPSTSRTSRRPARSGPTAPGTAATRCWARSATRCASPA